jgi:hypothetical protein
MGGDIKYALSQEVVLRPFSSSDEIVHRNEDWSMVKAENKI